MHQSLPTPDELRVLMAPMNLAMMPVILTEQLKARGYKAQHVNYTFGQEHPFGFRMDRVVNLHNYGGRIAGQAAILAECLEDDFNLYHFWNKSLFFKANFTSLSGMDLPMIKARGHRIAYRFSGFDLRLPTDDVRVNPYSPFNYGYPYPYDEALVRKYQDHLREYVDGFIVQDPELGQFMPDAHVVPRALDLTEWHYVGPVNKERPLVVHAPTNSVVKGTPQVLQAVEELRNEGVDFDFELIEKMSQSEAREIYERADIIVDQLLIGATGVLTLEGWALGKTVVVNVRPDLFNDFYGVNDLPIVYANPSNIRTQLRTAILDADLRADLGPRGRALVEEHHDIVKVTDTLLRVYGEILGRPPVRPTGSGDITYLEHLAMNDQNQDIQIRRLTKQLADVKQQQADLSRQHKRVSARLDRHTKANTQLTKKIEAQVERATPRSTFAPRKAAQFAWNNPPSNYFAEQRGAAEHYFNRSTVNARRTRRFTDAALDNTLATPVDLVISHDIWGLWAGSELRDRDGAAVVADMIEVPTLNERSGELLRTIPLPARRRIDSYVKRALMRADRVYTVSPSLATKVTGITGEPTHLLRNFRVETATRNASVLREAAKLTDAHRIIAFINTVAQGYGAEETVNALKHMDQRFQMVFVGRFGMVGYRQEFMEHVESQGVTNRVHFLTENFDQADFANALSGADVGVIATSSRVGNLQMAFPNRVTDYLSAGVPVVAHGMTDVDTFVRETGIGEVLTDLDPERMAEAMERLADPTRSTEVRRNIAAAQLDFNWPEESADFVSFCTAIAKDRADTADRRRPRVLIAARKAAANNGRIARMARSLAAAGNAVVVASMDDADFGDDIAHINCDASAR